MCVGVGGCGWLCGSEWFEGGGEAYKFIRPAKQFPLIFSCFILFWPPWQKNKGIPFKFELGSFLKGFPLEWFFYWEIPCKFDLGSFYKEFPWKFFYKEIPCKFFSKIFEIFLIFPKKILTSLEKIKGNSL